MYFCSKSTLIRTMKHLFTLCTALFLLTAVSCNKYDAPFRDELSGTCWKQVSETQNFTFYFDQNHKLTVVWYLMDKLSRELEYTYKDNKVFLKTGLGETYEGYIEDDVLYIRYSGVDLVLKRVRSDRLSVRCVR